MPEWLTGGNVITTLILVAITANMVISIRSSKKTLKEQDMRQRRQELEMQEAEAKVRELFIKLEDNRKAMISDLEKTDKSSSSTISQIQKERKTVEDQIQNLSDKESLNKGTKGSRDDGQPNS